MANDSAPEGADVSGDGSAFTRKKRGDRAAVEREPRGDRPLAEGNRQRNPGLSKNIGGLNNSLGDLVEKMFSSHLWNKFDSLGYTFTKGRNACTGLLRSAHNDVIGVHVVISHASRSLAGIHPHTRLLCEMGAKIFVKI